MTAPGELVHADARRILLAWIPPAPTGAGQSDRPSQQQLRRDYLDFLDQYPDAMLRGCTAGHLTASTLVFAHDSSRVLLTLHTKVRRWLQVGGHCEPSDLTLADAAAREAAEETGIDALALSDGPVLLDRHRVRCGPDATTEHLDVQFLAWAPEGAQEQVSSESLDLRWWPTDRLPEPVDGSVVALVEKGVALRPR